MDKNDMNLFLIFLGTTLQQMKWPYFIIISPLKNERGTGI